MEELNQVIAAKKPSKLMPAIWGGLLIGFLSGIPYFAWINCACCSGVIAGGFLAVYLYRNELENGGPLNTSDGAALGLFAGLLGALVAGILETLFAELAMETFYKFADYIQNTELEEWIYQVDPKNLGRGIALAKFFTNFVMFPIFGLTGGIIAVAIFSKTSKTHKLEE